MPPPPWRNGAAGRPPAPAGTGAGRRSPPREHRRAVAAHQRVGSIGASRQRREEDDLLGQAARGQRDARVHIRRVEVFPFEEGVRRQLPHAVEPGGPAMGAGSVDRVQQVGAVDVALHRAGLGDAMQVVVQQRGAAARRVEEDAALVERCQGLQRRVDAGWEGRRLEVGDQRGEVRMPGFQGLPALGMGESCGVRHAFTFLSSAAPPGCTECLRGCVSGVFSKKHFACHNGHRARPFCCLAERA
ncbi:hypothetical protein PHLH8_33560 [Pseudomonas sp. Pc102]|nr:hypothetical protein PHLH8_33560 [Pseudomonas sp. Pc102]